LGQTAAAILNFQQLTKSVEKKEFENVYLLHGTENYFLDLALQLLDKNILNEAEKTFDQIVLYGESNSMAQVIESARVYPMTSQRKVIIIRDFQLLLKNSSDNEKKHLEDFLAKPPDFATLIFSHIGGKLDSRTKLFKQFSKYSTFLSDGIKDWETISFIDYWLQKEHKNMDPNAKELLKEFIGSDLYSLENELVKLFANKGDKIISQEDVNDVVGFNRKYSVFELQKAIATRNFNKSIQIAHHMAAEGKPADLIPAAAALNNYFEKVLHAQELLRQNVSPFEIPKQIGVSPMFGKDYITSAQQFKPMQLKKVFDELLLVDMKLKGMHRGNQTTTDMWVGMVLKILQN
jgi:DNA polymerase III subunit delta